MGIIEAVFKPIGDLIGISPLTAMFLCVAVFIFIIAVIITVLVTAKRKKRGSRVMSPARREELATSYELFDHRVRIDPREEILEKEETLEEDDMKKEEKKTTQKVVIATAPAKKEAKVKAEKVVPKTTEKKIVAKSATAKPVAKPVPSKPTKKVVGKWIIEHKSDDEYLSKLLASNGEVMLTSEIYKSEDGAEIGISSIIRGIENGKFVIYQDKNKNYFYKLKTSGNRLLCVGEIYKSKDQCLKAVESVKRIANDSPVDDDILTGQEYIKYVPQKIKEEDVKKSAKGKWKIEQNEQEEYCAKLYANNGQLMLATEEVASKKNAEGAVDSVKKNALAGNFIIDRDKFGRYYYKLRNAQKSVVCIGEAYESLDSCVSAIESVRRFALNSDLVKAEK